MGATVTPSPRRPSPSRPRWCRCATPPKSYGPIQALHGVTLELRAGEVMCLAGENGAGKSTLIKILTGAIRRDSGDYLIDGEEVGNPSPAEAREAGIGVVYQELSLLPDLSVAENLLMGRLPAVRGVTRPAELRRQAPAMLERVGLDWLDPGTRSTRSRWPPASSSRSPRCSAPTRACSSSTSRRPRCPRARRRRCSRTSTGCATRVTRSCTSPTASRRCSRSATA